MVLPPLPDVWGMKGARRGGTPVTLAAGDRCPCSPSRRGRRDAACRGCTEGRDRRILNSWSALHCGGPGCRFRSSSGRHGSWRSLTAGGTGRVMARSQRRWLIRRGGACGFRSSGLSVFAQRLEPNFVDQQEMCTVKEPPQRSGASAFPELLRFAAFHCVGFRRHPTSDWCAHFPLPRAHSFLGRDRCPRRLTAGDRPGAASGPFACRATGGRVPHSPNPR